MPNIPLSRGDAHDMSAEYARRSGTPANCVRINSFLDGVYAQWQRGDISVGFSPTETAVHRIHLRVIVLFAALRFEHWIQRDADVPVLQNGLWIFQCKGPEKQETEDTLGTNA